MQNIYYLNHYLNAQFKFMFMIPTSIEGNTSKTKEGYQKIENFVKLIFL